MKFGLIIFGFICFGICGGHLSTFHYKDEIEHILVRKTEQHLEKIGQPYTKVDCDHMFVSYEVDSSLKQNREIAKQIDLGVRGVYVETPLRDYELSLTVEDDQKLVVTGLVGSDLTKSSVGYQVAKTTKDLFTIKNFLRVEELVAKPKWLGSPFLSVFLSTPGVTGFTANKEGFRIEGTVSSKEAYDAIEASANKHLKYWGEIENELAIVESKTIEKIEGPKVEETVKLGALLTLRPEGKGYIAEGRLPEGDLKETLISRIEANLEGPLIDKVTTQSNVLEPWWSASAQELLPAFPRATQNLGSVEYGENEMVLIGSLPSEKFGEVIIRLAGKGKPDNYAMNVTALLNGSEDSPELWAFRDVAGDIYLEGELRSSETGLAIRKQIELEFPNPIFDRIKSSKSVGGANWTGVGNLIVTAFGSIREPSVTLSGNEIRLNGNASSEVIKAEIGELAQHVVGSQGRVSNQIEVHIDPAASVEVPSAPEAGDNSVAENEPLMEMFKASAVYFASASPTIESKQSIKLGQVAEALRTTPGKGKLVVGGYADQTGNAEYNKSLSLQRANAVRDQLINLGVAADRLVVRHFGEDTSTINPEDLWKSRRVELSFGNE